jgi:hypothetical protein
MWNWDKYLMYSKETDIRLFTKNQIRLFINYFYAIHGYDFKNSLYKNYFQNLKDFDDDKRIKYRINPNFSENDFNEFERKNDSVKKGMLRIYWNEQVSARIFYQYIPWGYTTAQYYCNIDYD